MFKFLGIKDVKVCHTKQGVESALNAIQDEFILASVSPKVKILLFVYYAGHGEMKNGMTEIIFNEGQSDEVYQLEKKLTRLAKSRNTYTIAFFDCWRGKKKICESTSKRLPLNS